MELLRELVLYADRAAVSNSLSNSQLLQRFYQIVSENHILNEGDVRTVLYGGPSLGIEPFKKLKQRLRKVLIEHIISNPTTLRHSDQYTAKYFDHLNKLVAIKKFNLCHARHIGTALAESLLKYTIQYEHTDLTLYLVKDLHYYYTTINYQKAKSNKYFNLISKYMELFRRETISNIYFGRLQELKLSSLSLNKAEELIEAKDMYNTTQRWLKGANKSFHLILMCYHIAIRKYELEYNTSKILETCEQSKNALKNYEIQRPVAYILIDLQQLHCQLLLKQYQEVDRIASQYLKNKHLSTNNWFSFVLYTLISRLHNRDYQRAYSLFKEAQSKIISSKLQNVLNQIWLIITAYIYFLISINKIETSSKPKFRVYKFLNDIPMYTKDKRGMNISILIVHIIILLQQRRKGAIIDRIDALKLYCHRYLRHDDTFRAGCFIKMLIQISRAQFNRKRTERYTHTLYKNLLTMPESVANRNFEVEIIPYEDLWEMVLDLLD